MQSLLHGVTPRDPLTFAAVAAALMVVAILASLVPALARDARGSGRRVEGRVGSASEDGCTRTIWYSCSVSDRLFTPRFFVMCGFSFTVFLSAFQLLPTAPFHILDLGGSTFASGLFLGFLTYSSAFSAPLTGAYADRVGQRRVLIISSLALVVFSVALRGHHRRARDARPGAGARRVLVGAAVGVSAAYMTNLLPEHRRAEGIGYWGLSTLAAVAVAPTVGFWIYSRGWLWLCVSSRPAEPGRWRSSRRSCKERPQRPTRLPRSAPKRGCSSGACSIVSVTLALYSFGYGGITSFTAMYADANGVAPKGHLPDDAGDRDPADAADPRAPRGPLGLHAACSSPAWC